MNSKKKPLVWISGLIVGLVIGFIIGVWAAMYFPIRINKIDLPPTTGNVVVGTVEGGN